MTGGVFPSWDTVTHLGFGDSLHFSTHALSHAHIHVQSKFIRRIFYSSRSSHRSTVKSIKSPPIMSLSWSSPLYSQNFNHRSTNKSLLTANSPSWIPRDSSCMYWIKISYIITSVNFLFYKTYIKICIFICSVAEICSPQMQVVLAIELISEYTMVKCLLAFCIPLYRHLGC